MRGRLSLTLTLVLAIIGAGCGYSSPTTPTTATGPTVNITLGSTAGYDLPGTKGSGAGSGFQPGTLTVKVGDTVTWTNNDSTTHSPTADDGSFTGTAAAYATFAHKFMTAGTFPYHDALYPDMTATIIVQ